MSVSARTSFVIASRNRADELLAVVHRLLATTTSPIIVVDNASSDDSVPRLRAMAAGDESRRLTIVEHTENAGAVARNIGVAACRTPYVAFCDDDSWWAPDATAIGEAIFDRYPSVALLAARTVVLPGNRDDPIVADLADSPLGRDTALPGPSILGFLACSAMVRVDAFEAVGGFSPILHFRGEEQLLAWDLAAAGWDLCFCRALTAYHQPSVVRAPSGTQQARSMRNMVLTNWLRRPLRRTIGPSAQFVRAAIARPDHAAALFEAIRLIPAVRRDRRRLPMSVEQSIAVMESM